MMNPRWWTLVVPACILVAAACGEDGKTPSTSSGGKGGGSGKGGKGGKDGGASGEAGMGDGAHGNRASTGGKGASGGKGGNDDGGTAGASGAPDTGGTSPSGGANPIAGASTTGGMGAMAGSGPSGGTSPTAGSAPLGGEGGEGGADGGTGGTSGTGPTMGCSAPIADTGTPEVCSFAFECALSEQIPTVGVIDWSTDLPDLGEASIEFSLDDPEAGELNTGSGGPIDITGTEHRALMLGLKPERTYTYHLVAKSNGITCTSPDYKLTTGVAPGGPGVTRDVEDAAARQRGFVVTSSGYPLSPGVAYILDSDGDVVWWTAAPAQCARALMDWEGENLWMLATKPTPISLGGLRRIAMDGTDVSDDFAELANAHHDIAALPGGILAAMLWTGDSLDSSDLVERSPDGTLTTVVRLDDDVFKLGTNDSFHTNALLYHPGDDTYTVSELYAHAYVKLTRAGTPLWMLSTDCVGVPAPKCAKANLPGNHGHHLLDNDHLVLFNAAATGNSTTLEYSLSLSSPTFAATQVWSYEVPGLKSTVLGDAQRLPNGNTLITYSTAGQMHEVSPGGDVVQVLTAKPLGSQVNGTFGYASFRETLYGPPLR